MKLKIATWLLIAFLLVCSVFNIWSASLNSNHIILAGMLLLVSLYAELREFNFFGVKGTKYDAEQLRELDGGTATSEVDIDQSKVEEVERQPIQLMDTTQGNFLVLSFEIERLLRIYAQVMMVKDVPSNTSLTKLTKEMHDNNLLTDLGVRQLDAIRWVRNALVHGRSQEIGQAALDEALQIANNLYQELFNKLNGEQEK